MQTAKHDKRHGKNDAISNKVLNVHEIKSLGFNSSKGRLKPATKSQGITKLQKIEYSKYMHLF